MNSIFQNKIKSNQPTTISPKNEKIENMQKKIILVERNIYEYPMMMIHKWEKKNKFHIYHIENLGLWIHRIKYSNVFCFWWGGLCFLLFGGFYAIITWSSHIWCALNTELESCRSEEKFISRILTCEFVREKNVQLPNDNDYNQWKKTDIFFGEIDWKQ